MLETPLNFLPVLNTEIEQPQFNMGQAVGLKLGVLPLHSLPFSEDFLAVLKDALSGASRDLPAAAPEAQDKIDIESPEPAVRGTGKEDSGKAMSPELLSYLLAFLPENIISRLKGTGFDTAELNLEAGESGTEAGKLHFAGLEGNTSNIENQTVNQVIEAMLSSLDTPKSEVKPGVKNSASDSSVGQQIAADNLNIDKSQPLFSRVPQAEKSPFENIVSMIKPQAQQAKETPATDSAQPSLKPQAQEANGNLLTNNIWLSLSSDRENKNSVLGLSLTGQQNGIKEIYFLQENTGANQSSAFIKEAGFIERVIQEIQTNIKNNVQEAYIQLKPEYLGRAFMKVSLEDERVSIQMLVNNSQVREILESGLPALKDSLKEKGFIMDSFNVSVNSDARGHYPQQRHQLEQHNSSGDIAFNPVRELEGQEFQEELALSQGETYFLGAERINYLI